MTRRANGDGHIYQRRGRYYIQIYVRDSEGRRRIWMPGGPTLRGATNKLKEFKAKHCLGFDSTQTLNQWLTHWLDKHSTNKAESTLTLYRRLIDKHVTPAVGSIKLCDLKPATFSAFYGKLTKTLSARTVITINSILTAALNQAVRDEVLFRNVLHVVKKPKPERNSHRILSEDEFSAFMTACRKSKYHLAYLLMLFAGLRRGEALGMSWSCINIEKRYITVKQQLTETRGTPKIGPLKTARSYRIIPVPDFVIDEFLKTPARKRTGIICDRAIRNPRRFVADFKAITRSIGIENIRPHDLRHTHASHLLREKVPLPLVSARLGHANTRITGDVYAHEVPEAQDEAVIAMEAIVSRFDRGEGKPASMGPSRGADSLRVRQTPGFLSEQRCESKGV